jgi:hypothetical protein
VDGEELSTGDAVAFQEEASFSLRAEDRAEVILVDVPLDFELAGVWAR